MKKQRILNDKVAEPAANLWSNCMRVGDTVYIAGLTARKADGETLAGDNEYEQAHYIFAKFSEYIKAAGGCMDDIVQMIIYVTDMSKNREVWRAREEFFNGDFPTCTLVEVSKLAKPEILVEISATARLGCSE
jgi:enamine deaminase RidA (YjgF/YER057c/UK114 family)